MRVPLWSVPFLSLTASASAVDRLPLERGIYVEVGSRCVGAANAVTTSYWGADNGINTQRTDCRIVTVIKRSSTYALHRICRELAADRSFSDSVRVTIHDRTHFTLHGQPGPLPPDRSYRHCGPRYQSEP